MTIVLTIAVAVASCVLASLFIRFMGKAFDMEGEAIVGVLALAVFLGGCTALLL